MALVSYEDALGRVLARVSPNESVEVPIAEAPGLVTASDTRSLEDVPPFDNSAVDGFAVRSVDVARVPVDLEVLATIPAGTAPEVAISAGTCARIMTGAVVPDGADAIVMVEDTGPVEAAENETIDRVRIEASSPARAHIRPVGDDLRSGDVAIAAGTRLRPAHVGLLATLGLTHVAVHRRPRVGVMSTGDELVGPGRPLERGQIRDSNRVMLLALCRRIGVDAVDLGLVADDEAAIEAALRAAAADCDAIVTSGGVSMGDYDYVKAVLGRIGDMEWMQVAIKPAKPFAFGTVDGAAVFGLPGNPVSSLVSFELFAHPGLRAMSGDADPRPLRLGARLGSDIERRRDGKVHFVRVTLRCEGSASHLQDAANSEDRAGSAAPVLVATPTGAQGSHQLAASAGAEALALVPDGDGLGVGQPVEVIPLT